MPCHPHTMLRTHQFRISRKTSSWLASCEYIQLRGFCKHCEQWTHHTTIRELRISVGLLTSDHKERIKGHNFGNIKTLFQIIEEIDVYKTIPLCCRVAPCHNTRGNQPSIDSSSHLARHRTLEIPCRYVFCNPENSFGEKLLYFDRFHL